MLPVQTKVTQHEGKSDSEYIKALEAENSQLKQDYKWLRRCAMMWLFTIIALYLAPTTFRIISGKPITQIALTVITTVAFLFADFLIVLWSWQTKAPANKKLDKGYFLELGITLALPMLVIFIAILITSM
jgi:hypothetical protein